MTLIEKIKKLSAQYREEIIGYRRHLHSHPELSFEEHRTSAFVARKLKEYGVPFQTGIAQTGIVALVEGKKKSDRVLALRADMDALPIQETNNVPYKSQNPGVMHACGHDVHTSSLLGTARILTELREEFGGTVKFIFQPGEEKAPGGASLMIREGVLENPKPSAILGQHVMPFIETGKVGFRKGMYMASTDEIFMTVKGRGGHAAQPHLNIDPVLITSHIIVSLQQIVSRVAQPSIPTVLSFGKVIANGATNVIPDEVKVEGTFRTFNEKWRKEAHARMKAMAESIAAGMGGVCEFTIMPGYPFLVNDEPLTESAMKYAVEFLGKDNVVYLDLWMAGEDFAFYSQQTPACFYRLGTRNESKGITSPVHTPTFDVDENALETGMGLMAWLALRELGN